MSRGGCRINRAPPERHCVPPVPILFSRSSLLFSRSSVARFNKDMTPNGVSLALNNGWRGVCCSTSRLLSSSSPLASRIRRRATDRPTGDRHDDEQPTRAKKKREREPLITCSNRRLINHRHESCSQLFSCCCCCCCRRLSPHASGVDAPPHPVTQPSPLLPAIGCCLSHTPLTCIRFASEDLAGDSWSTRLLI